MDELNYLDLHIPKLGEITQIDTGIFWLRMPLPFQLDHINLWLLEDEVAGERGWTVVDTGISNSRTKLLWLNFLRTHKDRLPILKIICTHMHPDHFGLAHWLCNGLDSGLWKVPVLMTCEEYDMAKLLSDGENQKVCTGTLPGDPNENVISTKTIDFFKSHGCNLKESKKKLFERSVFYSSMVRNIPEKFTSIKSNSKLTIGGYDWSIILSSGHSPRHASLYCKSKQILISGDMILPKITSHVGVFPSSSDNNPLKNHLSALVKFKRLPPDTLVLPSHGQPFGGSEVSGLHRRLIQIESHHQERLDKILVSCENPKSVSDLLPIIFKRKLDSHNYTFAFTELLAHLNYYLWKGYLKKVVQNKIIKFIKYRGIS